MAYYYFPGCVYTSQFPESSAKLKEYLRARFDMQIAGCCRKDSERLTRDDTAFYICPTCLFKLQKSAPQANIISIWEILADDDQYPWPDYHNQSVTIQDCMDTRSLRALQDSLRRILRKMHVGIVEIEKSFESADFCRPKNEEQKEAAKKHCLQYTTATVTSCCTGCVTGLKACGVNGVHLMNLVTEECTIL